LTDCRDGTHPNDLVLYAAEFGVLHAEKVGRILPGMEEIAVGRGLP
jgi:hypothetical protein